MTKKTGDMPAFPTPAHQGEPPPGSGVRGVIEYPACPGMSLRAYIATAVLPSILAGEDTCTVAEASADLGIPTSEYRWKVHYPQWAAKRACAFADDLLAELSK